MQFINQFRDWRYFREAAFIIGVLLLLMAWKFAIEGLGD